MAIDAAQHSIAWRKGVHQAGLPGAGAGAGIENDLAAGCLKNVLEPVQDLFEQAGEFRAAMIYQGLRHRARNPLRDQSGTRNLQKRTAGHLITPAKTAKPYL